MANFYRLTTSVDAPFASLFYSDYAYSHIDGEEKIYTTGAMAERLRRWSFRDPLSTIIVGVIRVICALVHTLFHLLAGMATCEKGHYYHVAKGLAEVLHGILEIIPLVGWIYDRTHMAKEVGERSFSHVFILRVAPLNSQEILDVFHTPVEESPYQDTAPPVDYEDISSPRDAQTTSAAKKTTAPAAAAAAIEYEPL